MNRPLMRLGVSVFLAMNVMAVSMALWTPDVYAAGHVSRLDAPLTAVLRYIVLLLSAPVAWMLGLPLVAQTAQQLRRGRLTTDLLLIVGVAAALAYSVATIVQGRGQLYFEVACAVLVLVTLGRWLESTGKLQASAALESLEKLLPEQVRLVTRERDERLAPLRDVCAGDLLRVAPGERLPTDGVIVSGEALVDQQLITGESQPVEKRAGDAVSGGTLNLDGCLLVQATAPARGGALQRLIAAAREARLAQGSYQRLTDTLAAIFLPAVLIIALATCAWWTAEQGLQTGLMNGLAVVLIACPCALGLATPLAVWTALGLAANKQVLIRGGDALEKLARVKTVFFDKTGTLTLGRPTVADITIAPGQCHDTACGLAATIASRSTHPMSAAICGRFSESHKFVVTEARSVAGRGIKARVAGFGDALLGSEHMMADAGLPMSAEVRQAVDSWLGRGQSVCLLAWDGGVRGGFSFAESLRPEAKSAIERLRRLGLHVAVLSGDHAARAAALERELGATITGDLLPEQKLAIVRDAQRRQGLVAMVGDGVNDAPALAAADVGVAMACGADVSRDWADVCLLGDDLERLDWAISLARRTMTVIRQNLFWAFVYNTLGIALACRGQLSPIWAAAAMIVSSGLVIANSFRLVRDEEATQTDGPRASPLAAAREQNVAPAITKVGV